VRMGLFTMFAKLAEPPGAGTGAWRVLTGDGQEGLVLMEAGRVCWANHDAAIRLSDEIERRYGVPHATIEQVVRRCKETRKPFGSAIVEAGCITPTQLTSALRDHICRSILALVKAGVYQCDWVPHSGAGYAPETTISLPQTVSSCVALIKGLAPEELELALEAMLAGECPGLLLHVDSRLPLAASLATVGWSELRTWLTWGLRVAEVCKLPSRSFVSGRGGPGGWVVWRVGGIVGLAVTKSEETQRRLLLRVSSSIGTWTVTEPVEKPKAAAGGAGSPPASPALD
jgi:hypothetical protein